MKNLINRLFAYFKPKKHTSAAIKVVPPPGYLCFQFGNTVVVATTAREARRMMGKRFENHLKDVQSKNK